MTSAENLPADADKMPPDQLTDTHVPHPGVPVSFTRSTLLVGSRGAGKTFLLRHRRYTTHQGAIWMNLIDALQSLIRDSGLGGRVLDLPQPLSEKIQAKTAALVAAKVLALCCDDAGEPLPISLSVLDPLVPSAARSRGTASTATVQTALLRLHNFPLLHWPSYMPAAAFLDVLVTIADKYPKQLVLFLDRAEDAPTPSLELLLQLLDQTFPILTVIAARPSISQLLANKRDPTLVPGDHYDVLHIGSDPYDLEWLNFSKEATANFLAYNTRPEPTEGGSLWIYTLARDSVRDAAFFAQLAVASENSATRDARLRTFAALRAHRIARVRAAVYPDIVDFPGLLRAIHKPVRKQLRTLPQRAVVVRFDLGEGQLALLRGGDAVTEALQTAIRAEALTLPPGHWWYPYTLPDEFELVPLFAWDGENPLWIGLT